ncbi:MAG: MbnP family protein [Limisphaerales bacterium]
MHCSFQRTDRAHSFIGGGRHLWWHIIVVLFVGHSALFSQQREIRFEVKVQQDGNSVALSSLNLINAGEQRFSVSRLDFLMSNIAFQRTAGGWVQPGDWQAFISLAEGRSSFHAIVPKDSYNKVRFNIGLPAKINHSDPAQFPAHHPLNPNLNNLHWNWAGGYIFLALEGHWMTPEGKQSGYSFHLGNDWMLTTIELDLPTTIDPSDYALLLSLDRLLDLTFDEEKSSTHSREGDDLALQLKRNLANAFHVQAFDSTADRHTSGPLERAEGPGKVIGTPYPFSFSAQFPIPELPRDNPLTEEGVALGELLFFDPQLSVNGSQSCATCHRPRSALTDSPLKVSRGALGHHGERNSMPLLNLAWKKSFFWDGRTSSLRKQVLEPIENPIEMHENLSNVVAKLRVSAGPNGPDYPALFAAAFGSPEITEERLAKALEQFLLVQVSHDSRFDLALEGKAELTEEEKRGFELFVTEFDPRRGQFGADCFHCHGGPFFTNQGFANNGLDSLFADTGRYAVTLQEADKGKFAVPSLRNVELTSPYMHDGRFTTLEEVIEHYSSGVKSSSTLDPNIAKHPAGGVPLSETDKRALVAFLKTLTDEKYRLASSD